VGGVGDFVGTGVGDSVGDVEGEVVGDNVAQKSLTYSLNTFKSVAEQSDEHMSSA
jgi:hypothetical protein